MQGRGEALDDEAFEEGLREVEAAVEEGGAAGEGWGFWFGDGGGGEGGAEVVEFAVGPEEGGERDAVGLGGDAGQGDRGVEVREGAVDDADAAELVAGGEVGGREGGKGEAEAEGDREVDELCGGGWGVSSGDDGGGKRGGGSQTPGRRIQLLVRVVIVPPGCTVKGIGDVVHKLAHLCVGSVTVAWALGRHWILFWS